MAPQRGLESNKQTGLASRSCVTRPSRPEVGKRGGKVLVGARKPGTAPSSLRRAQSIGRPKFKDRQDLTWPNTTS